MSNIVKYLHCLQTTRSYSPEELTRLQTIYDTAQQLLGLEANDPRRQQLAILVFTVGDRTASPGELAELVVEIFGKS